MIAQLRSIAISLDQNVLPLVLSSFSESSILEGIHIPNLMFRFAVRCLKPLIIIFLFEGYNLPTRQAQIHFIDSCLLQIHQD